MFKVIKKTDMTETKATPEGAAIPQADGDCPNPDVCGCKGKIGQLDHLPEGSH